LPVGNRSPQAIADTLLRRRDLVVQDEAVTEQRPSSAYLGPEKGRWTPTAWSDVVEAAAGGLLDESHWVDLKQELPGGKRTHNTELAQDLASLAVDGGLLVIGIEDHDSRAGRVCGVELARLADRVDQVARDKVRPSLVVRSHEVPDPDRPGWGCLLVHVPPSAEAPHMVDYVYYGRGDRANARLGDEQVRAIIEGRRRGRADVTAELRQMADDDPIAADERQLGHLYLLAQPETTAEEVLVGLLARGDAVRAIQELLGSVVRERSSSTGFSPDVHGLVDGVPRAEGLALISYSAEEGPRREQSLLELVVREDGGIRLTCGRGTDAFPPPGWSPSDRPPMAVIAILVLGLANSVAVLAGRLADAYTAYQGQWRLGIRMDRLRGAVPLDRLQGPLHRSGHPYSRDEYERVTSASTEELVNAPHAVAERLVAPLLRGLGIASRYLPYQP
jgi:hypothetical protein